MHLLTLKHRVSCITGINAGNSKTCIRCPTQAKPKKYQKRPCTFFGSETIHPSIHPATNQTPQRQMKPCANENMWYMRSAKTHRCKRDSSSNSPSTPRCPQAYPGSSSAEGILITLGLRNSSASAASTTSPLSASPSSVGSTATCTGTVSGTAVPAGPTLRFS